eukprot:gnl/TRDRNA2_/TRDRNA2_135458_c0_seq1.p1 gnl/TRDRNA2_/TRDRNA2_135458_c0~~gnl/TRDRNA2_/TRDRNA2_135458_c0_seq1.p1  ORF type:complete len:251 (+),score=47.90 gnl/TRDRNA2_/TRDRNA2_135458_c0_seq1:169-921(+)
MMLQSSMNEATAPATCCTDDFHMRIHTKSAHKCAADFEISPVPSTIVPTDASTRFDDDTSSDASSEVSYDFKAWDPADSDGELADAESDSEPPTWPSTKNYQRLGSRQVRRRERPTTGAVAFKTVLFAMSSPPPPVAPPSEERHWIGLNELPRGAAIPEPAKPPPAPAAPLSGESDGDGTVNPRRWHIVGRRLASVFQEADPECLLPETKTITSPKQTVRPAWEKAAARMAAVLRQAASDSEEQEAAQAA